MKNKIAIALALLVTVFSLTGAAAAQEDKQIRSRYLKGIDLQTAIETARIGRSKADTKILDEIKSVYSDDQENLGVSEPQMVGTWNVIIPGPTPAETFYSMQTFGTGGTFVETSSLLGQLFEGPAHGVFECRARGCTLTFEVFEFAPDGSNIGKLRLRNAISLTDAAHFVSNFAVDFIEVDGTVIPDIATGSFTGEKMQVRGLY